MTHAPPVQRNDFSRSFPLTLLGDSMLPSHLPFPFLAHARQGKYSPPAHSLTKLLRSLPFVSSSFPYACSRRF